MGFNQFSLCLIWLAQKRVHVTVCRYAYIGESEGFSVKTH